MCENCHREMCICHLIKAKRIIKTWPKWKQECPYTTSSDKAFMEENNV